MNKGSGKRTQGLEVTDPNLSPLTSSQLRQAAEKFRLAANRTRQLERQLQRRGLYAADVAAGDVATLWDRFADRALTRAQRPHGTQGEA